MFDNTVIPSDCIFHEGECNAFDLTINCHSIFFVYAGELIIEYNNQRISGKKGEYLFFRKEVKVVITKKNSRQEPFLGVSLSLSETFLFNCFFEIKRESSLNILKEKEDLVIVLANIPCLESLYVSMESYLKYKQTPSMEIESLKKTEAVYALITVDDQFYKYLFDFILPLKFPVNYSQN